MRRSLPGASIVAITGGRISEWSDYYDSRTANRSRLADFFTDWREYCQIGPHLNIDPRPSLPYLAGYIEKSEACRYCRKFRWVIHAESECYCCYVKRMLVVGFIHGVVKEPLQ